MKYFLLFWAFILPVTFGGHLCFARETKLPEPEVETLPNGMKVAWFLDQRIPIVDFSVTVLAGFRDDPDGKSGTAELVSSVLDRGAAGMKAGDIAEAIESVGGGRYATVSDDTFSIGVHGLTSDAGVLLDVLAKMVTHPDFPASELKREQARLLDRWSHFEDYSETLVSLGYQRMITAGTSYGRGNVLSASQLQGVTRDDLLKYYRSYFVPSNMILVVVGQVDQPLFKQKVAAAFGNWKGETDGSPKKRFRKNYTWKGFPSRPIVLLDRPDLTQAQIRIGSPSVSIHSSEHYALRIANAILGEMFNSRLNSVIRDKLGLAYAISSSFSYYQDFAEFNVSTATQNTSVGPIIRKVLEILNDFSKTPISSQEVEAAKQYLIGGFSLANSTLNSVAGRWITGIVFGLGPEYLNEFIPKIKQVSVDEVNKAAKKIFDPDQKIVIVAGDSKAIQKSLQLAEFKSIKLVSASDLK